MTFLRIFPAKLFEGIGGEVTKIQTGPGSFGVGNHTPVSAVTGKRIRVHGWSAQTEAGAGTPGSFQFTDGSGGSNLSRLHYAPLSTVSPAYEKPFIDSGYFETTAGTGLGLTVATSNVKLEVYYSVYTPD